MNIGRTVVATCLLSAGALFAADSTPVMVSLVTPAQFPSRFYDVTGLRLSFIYGECQDFTGLDIGIIGNSRKEFTGLAIGGFNFAGERLYGGQVGLVNWNAHSDTTWGRRSVGAQIGALNYAGVFCGLQDGIVNVSEDSFMGMQSGLVNFTHDLYGLQCGYYLLVGVNVASGTMHGCQIGLVNYVERLEGVQIGLLNFATSQGFFPIINIGW
jgi:hypothetical protein